MRSLGLSLPDGRPQTLPQNTQNKGLEDDKNDSRTLHQASRLVGCHLQQPGRLCRRLGGFERWRKFAHQELGNLHTMPWQWQEMEFWRALRLVAATVAKSELPTDPRRAACGLDGQTPSRGITPYTPQSGWVCTVASIFNIFSIQRLVVAAVFARGSASGHQQSVAQRFPPGPRGPWRLPI